jgi:alpha-L-arabinofuranosidase
MVQGVVGADAPHWRVLRGTAKLEATAMNAARPRSLRLNGAVSNEGYWGVPLQPGTEYQFSAWVRGGDPSKSGALKVGLGATIKTFAVRSGGWQEIKGTLRTGETNPKGALVLEHEDGDLWLSMVSLKPAKTWGKAKLRPDLARMVADIKPSFVRFPGGCFVEGQDFDRMWDWKASIGSAQDRPGKDWRFWGYSCTDGLGYHEYLQWCEDMKSDALFVANCGMSHGPVVPMKDMGRVVQDALDAIEYALGPVESEYGAKRAQNGHPQPFKLRYVQIGNENGGPAYDERYALIAAAIKKQYPEIELVACVWGGVPKSYPLEIIDEHYYATPSFFWANAHKYDKYNRKGPKIYVGEYAVTRGCGEGNLAAALGEAAFMTGMERNSDIVKMASYAPLFANANRKQWNPNAIVFDNHRSYGTPSYWVQQMFGQNRPDHTLETQVEASAPTPTLSGRFGFQTWRTHAEFRNVQMRVNGQMVTPTGWEIKAGQWRVTSDLIEQTDLEQDRQIFAKGVQFGSNDDYDFEFEARKRKGDEGFIIMTGDPDLGMIQWNLGGWGNVTHAFQVDGARQEAGAVRGRIDTDRWYALAVRRRGTKIQAFLDGKLFQEQEIPKATDFAAVAGYDAKRRELVLKIVNGAGQARSVSLNLSGRGFSPDARVWTLTSDLLSDENSLATPQKIVPRMTKVKLVATPVYAAPARSVSVLRVRVR